MRTLILASTSTARQKILSGAGFTFQTVSPGVDESTVTCADPVERAVRRAELKAREVALRHPTDWVIGADQVVFDGVEVFGKPTDAQDHLARLQGMRGRAHDLVTGFAVMPPGGSICTGHDRTRLVVRADLTDTELQDYVSSGEGTYCAGGYAIEGHGGWLFESIEGDYFNILGLPLVKLISVLRELGWRYENPA